MAGLTKCGLVAVSLAVWVCAASGGIIASDPNGMSGWRGTVLFDTTNKWLYTNVDYGVYAPGQFSLSFPLWTDPTGGSEYVYAYQIFNNVPRTSSVKAAVSYFSVGLNGEGAEEEQAHNIGYLVDDPNDPNHKPPTDMNLDPDDAQAGWYFSGTTGELKFGRVSYILLFTSPFAPEMDSSSISGSYSLTAQRQLPSPTPEPATAALLGAGLIALARPTRARRKR